MKLSLRFFLFLGAFTFGSVLFGNSLSIFNDSMYELTATVYSADGQKLGSMTVASQNQFTWYSNYQNTNTDYSQTPYSVHFSCPSGSDFGVVDNASPGATVTAMSSMGRRMCTKKQEEKIAAEKKAAEQSSGSSTNSSSRN